MSDSQSVAAPLNLDSLQSTRNGASWSHESEADAPLDVELSTGVVAANVTSAGSGKRKLPDDGESSNEEEKRVRKDDSSPGSSDMNEASLEEDEERIGQPRVAYPITAPLVKTKPTPLRAPQMPDVRQGISVPGVVPGVVPSVVSGMIPSLALPLGRTGVGSVPMLSFGGAVTSQLNMATLANLQALQMNQLLKAFIPSVNNLSKLLTNEQMALLAAQMSSVSPQMCLHPRPLLSVSSTPSSVTTTSIGNSFSRPLQHSNTSTPGPWVLDSVRQTLNSQREAGRTAAANRDDSHSNLTIDQQSGPTTDNSSESDEARFRVSDAESSANGFRVAIEATPPNGEHLSQQQDQSYQERRRKNNDSARRSRDARRSRIDETAKRVAFLEMENLQMRAIIEAEREYLARMHQDLMQRKGAWNPVQFAALQQVLNNLSATNAARFFGSGQQVATTPKSSASVKQELTDGSDNHLDCDVKSS